MGKAIVDIAIWVFLEVIIAEVSCLFFPLVVLGKFGGFALLGVGRIRRGGRLGITGAGLVRLVSLVGKAKR